MWRFRLAWNSNLGNQNVVLDRIIYLMLKMPYVNRSKRRPGAENSKLRNDLPLREKFVAFHKKKYFISIHQSVYSFLGFLI